MKFASLALAALVVTPASAKTIILCKGQGRPDVVITLQDRRAASHTMSSDRIYFDGGFMGSEGMKVDWSFYVSRLTGVGVLHREGKPDENFSCGAVKPKF